MRGYFLKLLGDQDHLQLQGADGPGNRHGSCFAICRRSMTAEFVDAGNIKDVDAMSTTSTFAPTTPAVRHIRQVFHRCRETVQCVTCAIRRQRRVMKDSGKGELSQGTPLPPGSHRRRRQTHRKCGRRMAKSIRLMHIPVGKF